LCKISAPSSSTAVFDELKFDAERVRDAIDLVDDGNGACCCTTHFVDFTELGNRLQIYLELSHHDDELPPTLKIAAFNAPTYKLHSLGIFPTCGESHLETIEDVNSTNIMDFLQVCEVTEQSSIGQLLLNGQSLPIVIYINEVEF